jgi:hypothetical protein
VWIIGYDVLVTATHTPNVDNILGWSAPHIRFAAERLAPQPSVERTATIGRCRYSIVVPS